MRANLARQDRQHKAWVRKHAALYADNLEAQLTASLESMQITEELGPLDILFLKLEDELTNSIHDMITRKLLLVPSKDEEQQAREEAADRREAAKHLPLRLQ